VVANGAARCWLGVLLDSSVAGCVLLPSVLGGVRRCLLSLLCGIHRLYLNALPITIFLMRAHLGSLTWVERRGVVRVGRPADGNDGFYDDRAINQWCDERGETSGQNGRSTKAN
jgi:hypothetical protein